jgi:ribA/ribD-fused uncharacterized protein
MASSSDALPTVVHFYSHREEPFGCFSNFSPHSFKAHGIHWTTSEHYFQAFKFPMHSRDFKDVVNASSPGKAATIGRDRSRPLRKDWEAVKEQVMYEAVKAKFSQNADIHAILMGTGDATLVEHTFNDSYWGDGGDGSGKNRLGFVLEKVRKEFADEYQKASAPTTKAAGGASPSSSSPPQATASK